MSVATSLVQGAQAQPELAAEAVRRAMERAGVAHPRAILLYLSAEFAHDPQPALTAAARAGNCMQVVGCSASGLFTEDDWSLDAPAAAALVFGGDIEPRLPRPEDDWRLSLAAPNAIDTRWLDQPGRRFGGVSGDATGQGPYGVWQAGRLLAEGRCELAFAGVETRVAVARGLLPLGESEVVTGVDGHDLTQLAGRSALSSLIRALSAGNADEPPLHRVMACVVQGATENALAEGRYDMVPVLSANFPQRSVTVASQLEVGDRLIWALRQPAAALADLERALDSLAAPAPPAFGLAFSCLGRGPLFYDGLDRDLERLTRRYPGMPLLGLYGNGQFAWRHGANQLLQYSLVLGVFHHVQP